MAPIDRYLIPDAGAEISLAKSAAPKSISDSAEVILLKRQGYQTAVKGTNGFVCIVQRSWAAYRGFLRVRLGGQFHRLPRHYVPERLR